MHLERFVKDSLSICYIEILSNLDIKNYNEGFKKLFNIHDTTQKLDFYLKLSNGENFTYETLEALQAHGKFYLHSNQNIPYILKCEAKIVQDSLFLFADIIPISEIEVVEKLSKITSELSSTTRELHKKNMQLTQAKKELEEKEKMIIAQSRFVAMNELLLMLSHQWRQPLNTISLYTQKIGMDLQNEELHEDAKIQREIQTIYDTTQKLSGTIDIFTSHMAQEHQVLTSVNDVLEDVCKLVTPTLLNYKINLKRSLLSKLKINLIPSMLSQICMIVIQNSIDAFERNKTIGRTFCVETYDDEGFIYITYKDNAGGVSSEILQSIFEPYFSTKEKKNGVGLGLYIATLLIKKIFKGTISLQNSEDGVKVSMIIPYTRIEDAQ